MLTRTFRSPRKSVGVSCSPGPSKVALSCGGLVRGCIAHYVFLHICIKSVSHGTSLFLQIIRERRAHLTSAFRTPTWWDAEIWKSKSSEMLRNVASGKLVTIHQFTQRNIPDHLIMQTHCCENPEVRNAYISWNKRGFSDIPYRWFWLLT